MLSIKEFSFSGSTATPDLDSKIISKLSPFKPAKIGFLMPLTQRFSKE